MNKLAFNNDWLYKPSFKESYIKDGLQEALEVRLPHTNVELPYHYFDEKAFQIISSYQKTWTQKVNKKKEYFLHFEAAMNTATIYVNGKELFTHYGGYTPFTVDITSVIKDGENTVFVKLDSTERKDVPPFGFVIDYLTYGGIYREVQLIERNPLVVDDVFVHTTNNDVIFETTLSKVGELEATFNILRDKKVVHTFKETLKDIKTIIKKELPLELWELDNPVMYTLQVLNKNDLMYQTRFAKRSVEFRTDGFYLNDKPLKLRGLNRHQSYPHVGYAMPKRPQQKDADIMKYDLGCNIVRSSNYPPSRHFLDRCDEIGLLVFNELPGWQHIGDDLWKENAKNSVKEMILRDRNHPSVIIWGVRINESPDDDTFYQETNEMARRLDPTRQTGGVRNFKGSHFYEDVYTYNDFVHRGNNVGLEKPLVVTKKEVPYLVTEYNGHMYPTKPFDDEIHRINHVKRHLNVQNQSYKDPNISGAIGWCMFDYNTHKDFGSGDKICYHGVLDMYRHPKYASYVYASQKDGDPFLEVASNLQIGDFEASEVKEVVVLTNCDEVKFYINEDYINTFTPSKDYENLPHPPVIIDDFIGRLIHENEPFSEKDASQVKDILLHIMRNGMKLPLKLQLRMRRILKKYDMTIDQAAKMYENYVGKWGLESLTYTFEGYKDGQLAVTKKAGPTKSNHLTVSVEDDVLEETETYDVTKINVFHLDEHDRVLPYSNEIITLYIEGPLEIIGPKQRVLRGGSTAFYVKTIGKKGQAKLTVSTERLGMFNLEIKVN